MREYGLIGFPLSHSFSQRYFTEKFSRENINDTVFLNFSIPKIEDVAVIFSDHPQLKGLAVTIPYKKSVIKYLDETDEVVKEISACNCVKIDAHAKTGYNTDVIGFERSFAKNLKPHHTKGLVLGTGGAASAVKFVLQKIGIEYLVVSRTASEKTISYNDITSEMLSEHPVIINCTPLGTYPNIQDAPPLPYRFLNASHYLFDLVYNPLVTKFLQYGKNVNCTIQNGYEMLVIQAEENWKIWNS
ncbi:MAG TPA: shikimate dehydrogenase [Parafilimonas sp.]|nr:shikimate dehydrogenase [Parafilimonas sp.]